MYVIDNVFYTGHTISTVVCVVVKSILVDGGCKPITEATQRQTGVLTLALRVHIGLINEE